MYPISIYALTRIEDDLSLERLERQMSGRERFLKIKDWEISGLRQFCSRLYEVMPDTPGLKFFYSFTMPKLGKEFDLLRINESSVVNIELKSGNVTEEAIKRQLLQNKYYLAMLGKSIYSYTFISRSEELLRLSNSGNLVSCSFDELARILGGQEDCYTGRIEDLFREDDYLISPLTDPDRFLRGDYFLTSQQRDIRHHILKSVTFENGSIRKEYMITGFTGLPGTGKSILLYDLAMQLSKKETVCVLHIGSYEKELDKLDARLKRVDFYYCDPDKDLVLLGRKYAAILVDEGHKLSEKQYLQILDFAKGWHAPVIVTFDKEDAVAREERDMGSGRLITGTEGYTGYQLTNRIRLNNELSYFIACVMRIKGRNNGRRCPSVSLAFANDVKEAGELIKVYDREGYDYIRDDSIKDPVIPDGVESVEVSQAAGKEFEKVLMLLDGSFYYDEDGYLRRNAITDTGNPEKGDSGVRKLFHGLNRAKKKIAIVVMNNPGVFEGILSILQRT